MVEMTTRRIHKALRLAVIVSLLPAAARAQESDPTKGHEVYELYCATCHGNEGRGDGELAARLDPRPRNLADQAYMERLSDEYLREFITRGGSNMHKSPMMPSWAPVLRAEDVRNVVVYIRRLGRR